MDHCSAEAALCPALLVGATISFSEATSCKHGSEQLKTEVLANYSSEFQ